MSPWLELSAEMSEARFAPEPASSVPVMFEESRMIDRLASGSIVEFLCAKKSYNACLRELKDQYTAQCG